MYAGLALIAIGAGGIKPCVSAFVGDQFRPDQAHLLTQIYGWFYWSVNLGATAAFLIIPPVHKHYGYAWAFGIPGIFMGIATFVFWLGTKYYIRQPPQSQSRQRPEFFGVIWHALTIGARQPGQKFFLSLSRFTSEEVQGARTASRVFSPSSSPICFFWALYYQSTSTWILQGNSMTPFSMTLPIIGPYTIDGEVMQSAGSILVMILVPIFTLGVYPMLEKIGILPTALRRMSVGMVAGAVSFIVCGFLQYRVDHGAQLSVLWQLAPYTVLEIGEVLVSATALEFAFSQAPASMKSIIMSFWLMTVTGGNLLIALVHQAQSHVSSYPKRRHSLLFLCRPHVHRRRHLHRHRHSIPRKTPLSLAPPPGPPCLCVSPRGNPFIFHFHRAAVRVPEPLAPGCNHRMRLVLLMLK